MTNFSNKNDVIVDVSNVAIKFCRDLKKSLFYGVKDIANDLIGRSSGNDGLRSEEFWALKDINFDLKRGETLGLIGLNGSGKSTLLKILHGLIKPSKGKASIRGITGGLIDLALVGQVDDEKLSNMVIKTEGLINRKIRTLVLNPEDVEKLNNRLDIKHAICIWNKEIKLTSS